MLRELASRIWQNAGRAKAAGRSFVDVFTVGEPDNSRYFFTKWATLVCLSADIGAKPLSVILRNLLRGGLGRPPMLYCY